MARASYRLEPKAEAQLESYVTWLEERNPAASARFVGALEHALDLLTFGLADGRLVTLTDGRRVRQWPVAPLVLFYLRREHELIVALVRHGAQRPVVRE